MPRFPFRRTPARRSAATRRLVAAGGGFVALALAVQPAAALLSPAGVAVPNTNTASPTAQLAAGPTIVSKLAVPFNPAVAPPAALAGLTSPASPQDDLAGALSSLAADTTPAAVQADRQRALDILEGNAIAGKAYSGIPLLNWNPPAKVKTVPAGGNVVVQDVRFGDQVLSDTWLLSFADPTQPFTITYRVSDLNNTPSELTPTPLLADGATPIGGLNSVVRNLLNDANLDTGTIISNRFATNAPEQTRQTVEDIVVRMPAPRFVSAILDPNLVPGEEGQAALLPATADRLAAATAAFGFSGASPTATEKTAAIDRLSGHAPERLLWTDLTALNPADLAGAHSVGTQDASLVAQMLVHTEIPPGVATAPAANLAVALVNNEAYVSARNLHVTAGRPITVSVTNDDHFAHTFQATDLHDRNPVFGPLNWGQFAQNPLALGAPADMPAGATRTFVVTPSPRTFGLMVGDPEHGDQATTVVNLHTEAPLNSLHIKPDFADPMGGVFDGNGALWVALHGIDSVARITGVANPATAKVEQFQLPGGSLTQNIIEPKLGPTAVAIDGHGIVWATLANGNAIARLDPAAVKDTTANGVKILPLAPCGTAACAAFFPATSATAATRSPEQLAIGQAPDGSTVVWFTERNADAIGMMIVRPDGTLAASLDIACGCSSPMGVAIAPDGTVWFSGAESNSVGRILATGAVQLFGLPSSGSFIDPLHKKPVATSYPNGVVVDHAGRVFVAETAAGKVAVLDPAAARPGTSSGITELSVGPNPFGEAVQPSTLTVDRKNTVFFASQHGDLLGSLTATGQQTVFRPQFHHDLMGTPVVDRNGNLWFTEQRTSTASRLAGVAFGDPSPAGPVLTPAATALTAPKVVAKPAPAARPAPARRRAARPVVRRTARTGSATDPVAAADPAPAAAHDVVAPHTAIGDPRPIAADVPAESLARRVAGIEPFGLIAAGLLALVAMGTLGTMLRVAATRIVEGAS